MEKDKVREEEKKKEKEKEKDLFEPVRRYFEALGYSGDGEVKDIDLYMEKDGKSLAVELKQTLDFRALQQAALRQKIADTVYIGIFQPKNERSRSFQEKLFLLKRLGIGLLVVSGRTGAVREITPPVASELKSIRQQFGKRKKEVSGELEKRRAKNNIGGVHGTKLMTAYREEALLVLDALSCLGGCAAAKDIRKRSGVERSTRILYDNHYGWFDHRERGCYQITRQGQEALEEFRETLALLKHSANVH